MCDFLPTRETKCTWTKASDPETSPHEQRDWKRDVRWFPDILCFIGNTPIVKLNRIPKAVGLECEVYAKCEFLNPGGSNKDRVALRAIEDAETSGALKPDGTLIVPTSGNTGLGVALASAVKGYRCIIVMTEKISHEKEIVLRALGSEIVRTPKCAGSADPEGIFGTAKRLADEIPNSLLFNQFLVPGNPLSHYDGTAEEIYDALDGKVDMIVIGVGSGGTITGIGRKFKEKSPDTIIVGADPEGSTVALPEYLNRSGITFYEVEGIGGDFVPTILDRSVVDKWVKTNDKTSCQLARRLIAEEGLLCGASSGSVLQAAIAAGENLTSCQKLVVVLPDTTRNYLTKFVCDQWMEARSFRPCTNCQNHWWWDKDLSCLNIQEVTASIKSSCHRVLHIMKKNKIKQVPLVNDKSELDGVAIKENLINGLVSGKVKDNDEVDKISVHTFPKILKNQSLGLVSRVFQLDPYAVVVSKIYAKCEFLNPGGSVKDRVALRAIEDAEAEGVLKPGGTLIVPTSGNTGLGVALASAVKGYRCIIVMPQKMSHEKEVVLRALGSEIVRTPNWADSSHNEGIFGTAKRLSDEIPNSFVVNQYLIPGNPLTHYDGTAEEIYNALEGQVDMIVASVGSGGTITGIGRKFKERSPNTIIVGADPEGSTLALPEYLNKTDVKFYEVEGIGYDFVPTVIDRSVIDRWVKTNDKTSFQLARRLIAEEGILCGASSGSVMQAAFAEGGKLTSCQKLLVILPDGTRNYLTKFVCDNWMEARSFKLCINFQHHWWWDRSLSCLHMQVFTASSKSTCHQVLHIMKKNKVKQVPILNDKGDLLGVVTMQGLANGVISGKVKPNDEVEKITVQAFPKVSKNQNLGVVSRVLQIDPYVVVVSKIYCGGSCIEKPVGLITPVDLLAYIVNSPENQKCGETIGCS